MALFKPNLNCEIRKSGSRDVYGKESLGPSLPERCSIIYARTKIQDSSVRADSSASRGAAKERVLEAKILLEKNTAARLDDQIIVHGMVMRIVSVFPRHDLLGKMDHWEIECTSWGKA